MSGAVIIGAGMIPMGRHRNSSYPGLAVPAVSTALSSAGVSPAEVGYVACGHSFGGMLTGQRIVKDLGIGGVPVINVDNACSGGAAALQLASKAVVEGITDVALAIGVDKLSQFGGGTLPLVEEDPEVRSGMVMPALYAMRARRFFYERGEDSATLAEVSVKARRHGAANPFAQYRTPVTSEEVLAARMIADPLTLLMCCPTGDGAAAVVIASQDRWRKTGVRGAHIRASVLHSGKATTGFRHMLRPEITVHSAHEAYEAAGIGPEDIDVIELHDAFSIAELIYYEALGLCPEGDAAALLKAGQTTYGGKVVVNPSGGLISKGHPVGASGVAQAVEVFWHLCGQAGKRQVEGARFGLCHVTGGGISGMDHGACTIHLLETARNRKAR
jgi:benzoylsuccinyl-CoA thiolase BbsB subunit